MKAYIGVFFVVGETKEQFVISLREMADMLESGLFPSNGYGGSTEHGGEWDFDVITQPVEDVFAARDIYAAMITNPDGVR